MGGLGFGSLFGGYIADRFNASKLILLFALTQTGNCMPRNHQSMVLLRCSLYALRIFCEVPGSRDFDFVPQLVMANIPDGDVASASC